MTDLSAIERFARMRRYRRNTAAFMERRRVRCYARDTFNDWTTIRCFGSIHHPGDHIY